MLLLSDFSPVLDHVPGWNGSVWGSGHPGSGRQPSSVKYDPRYNKREHNGCDWASTRTKLYAPHEGWIRLVRWQNNGAGNAVTINHGDVRIDIPGIRFYGQVRKVYSRHLHMGPDKKWQTKTFLVKERQWVEQDQPLGYIGSSGASAGPHCHCELHVDLMYQAAYRHKSLDTEWIYSRTGPRYWMEDDMAMVTDMQKSLNRNGFRSLDGYPLVVDGNWGRKTAEANESRDAAAAKTGSNIPAGYWVKVWGKEN